MEDIIWYIVEKLFLFFGVLYVIGFFVFMIYRIWKDSQCD